MIDRRIRLRPKTAGANYVYGDFGNSSEPTLLSFLRPTNGLVWTVTPTVTEQRSVQYETQSPIHTNSNYNNYKNTTNTIFTIQGEFYAGLIIFIFEGRLYPNSFFVASNITLSKKFD